MCDKETVEQTNDSSPYKSEEIVPRFQPHWSKKRGAEVSNDDIGMGINVEAYALNKLEVFPYKTIEEIEKPVCKNLQDHPECLMLQKLIWPKSKGHLVSLVNT